MNRVLAEGRDRFRALLASSEDGSRCRELRPLLSAFCDGEASPADAAKVREHLRACARCRSTMRAYRAAPRIAIALAPAFPPSRSLLERVQEHLTGLASRLPGIGGSADATTQVAAAGGGGGVAAIAKLLAVCAGGAAACVATGVVPSPLPGHEQSGQPPVERMEQPGETATGEAPRNGPTEPVAQPDPVAEKPPAEIEQDGSAQPSAPTGAVEYEPPPPPEAPPPSEPESPAPSGSAAGEFGP